MIEEPPENPLCKQKCLHMEALLLIFITSKMKKGEAVKQSEFVKWLKKQGATFEEGTNHTKVRLKGLQSHLPRHPSKELKTGLVEGVKKQLNLK